MLGRALGLLGPTEAVVAMAAFLVVLLGAGWHPGAEVTAPVLAGASGAAFTAIVVGQFATAFACRSTNRPVWSLRWRGNPLLLGAVAVEGVVLVAALVVATVADLLGHRPPPLTGLLVAAVAVPAVVLVDALAKAARRRSG